MLPASGTPLLRRRHRKVAGIAVLVAATSTLLPAAPGLAIVAVTPPSPAFTQTSAQTVTSTYMSQVADMNEDGKLDIVSSQLSGPQGFAIELGNGNGTFAAPVVTAVAKQHGVNVGDVNGDGHQDVVIRSNTSGSIQVFFGTGTGAVTAGTPYVIPRQSSGATANGVYPPTLLKDFDNDGRLDLAVPLYQGTVTGYFTILKGNGLGGFSSTDLNLNISQAYGLAAADLNGDGYADLVATDDYLRQMSVFLSDGTGAFHFRAPATYPYTSSTITDVVIADLNKDAKPDLVTANSLGLISYLNNGSGAFTAVTVAGGSHNNVATADFNGDGNLDLASENNTTLKEELYLGSATGTFTVGSASYTVRADARTARAADFNGDGHPDLHVSSYGTSLSRVFTYQSLVGAPAVTTNPANQTVTAGQTATFTAAASASPTVQWQKSTDSGGSWNDITGAVSTTYTTPATAASDDGTRFRAVFTNAVSTATSTAATLTVLVAPAVTSQPTDQTVNAGGTATFTAAVSGNPSPTVQWQRSTNGGASFTNLPGQTSTTLSFTATAADSGNTYRLVATNSSSTATSNPAGLTVISPPQVTGQPADQTVASGQNASFTATSGGSASTVQWQVRPDAASAWTDLAGQTSGTLTFPVLYADSGTSYRAVFSNSAGSATSSPAIVTVSAAAPSIVTAPSDQTVLSGQTATFTAAASGDPTPTVQWQRSTDSGSTFADLPGETAATLAVVTTYADNGFTYRAVFTNPGGSTTTSTAVLTVIPTSPTVTGQPADESVTSGQVATFSVAGDGDPAPTVQWQRSTDDGATFTDLLGETGSTLTFATSYADSGFGYRAVLTSPGGTTTSLPATLTVAPIAPTVTSDPVSQTVAAGSPVTFTAAGEGDPTPDVQWQRSTDNGATFTDLLGETSGTLSLTPAVSDDQSSFRAVFTSAGGTATTGVATLTVTDAPVVTGEPQDTTVNEGSTATFTSTASGTPTPTVQWQVSTDDGQTWTDLSGATTTTYTTDPVASTDDGNQYRAVYTNSTGTAAAGSATLTVTPTPAPVQDPPSAPRNVKATQTGPGQITVTWDVPSDPGSSPVTGYDVGYGNGGSGNGLTVPGTTRKAVFVGLSKGSYQASVAASNAVGAGLRVFTPVTVTGTAAVPPPPVAAPTTHDIVSATATDQSVTIQLGPGALLTSRPKHGSAAVDANGTVTYTPASGYFGADSFRYQVTDAAGKVTVGTITVQVGQLPFTGSSSQTQVEWALGVITLGGLLLRLGRRRRVTV
jgi:hypothetical protein